MRALTAIALCLTLIGCAAEPKISTADNDVKIVPTTGVFTSTEEAVYQTRFENLVLAFASGKTTADYDTEIYFGTNLEARPLPRNESQSLSQELIAQLAKYAGDYNSDSFLIAENGRIISETYFKDIDAKSLINAKSLAKPFGVVAIGRAIKLGFIESLEQAASDYIIEWKGTDREAIKIKQLLDMTSGLLPQGRARSADDVLNRAYLHPRHEEVIIHEYPLVNAPGTRYDYSNANSEIVAVIINRATSMPYQDWLAKEVLAPLGAEGGKIWINRPGGTAHSGCCIGLTSETYLKLGLLVLQNGKWEGETLLTADFMDKMLTPTVLNKYAGMGIFLGRDYKKNRGSGNPDKPGFGDSFHSEPYIDKDIALFDGNGNQVVYIMPSRNLVIMRLGPRPKHETPWDNAFIPNVVSRHLGKLD